MKILHAAISIDRKSGGPSTVICELALAQAKLGWQVVIFTCQSTNPFFTESPHSNLKIEFVSARMFRKSVRQVIVEQQIEIVHLHGLWQLQIHDVAVIARSLAIPFLITPHGTLHPWALSVKKWKKKLAMALYQSTDLKSAACLHATSAIEGSYFRSAGLRNPIAIIPNGIDLKEYGQRETKSEDTKRTALFLSRVHTQKGLDNLINAWSQIGADVKKNWTLQIAGVGENDYILTIKSLISKYKLENEVTLTGPKYGVEKINCYLNADLFILPSFSENFGIVVAEALACAVPVITTKGTPWQDLENYNCGWWIDIGVAPLVAALEDAMTKEPDTLRQMGRNGQKLAAENYSIEAVAAQTIELYSWIIDKSIAPKFVMQ